MDDVMIEREVVVGIEDSICLSAVLRMSMYKRMCLPEMRASWQWLWWWWWWW